MSAGTRTTQTTKDARRPAFRPGGGARWSFVALVALAGAALPVGPAFPWSEEDEAYARYLIRELRYFDTARRWLAAVEKRRLSDEERARVAALRIDILLGEGREAEAKAAQERFEKEFPKSGRVGVSRLDLVSLAMGKVIARFEKAMNTADAKAAADLRAEASKIFREEVEKPLDELIAGLNQEVEDLRKKAAAESSGRKTTPDRQAQRPWDALTQTRDQAELSRIKAYLVYARRLPAESPERKAILEKALGLADRFVDERYEYYVMQYEGQLQRGIIAHELARHATAEEYLSVLYDVQPPGDPPYPKALAGAFKQLRLQAVLFGARSAIASGQSARAARLLEEHFLGSRGPLGIAGAEEDPSLRQFAVLARLEYGVALAGSGNVVAGLEQIQQVIRKYSSAGLVSGANAEFVNEARKALGRLAGLPGVELRGEDLYEAALGLKSALRFEDAAETFRRALGKLDPSKAKDRTTMARCLNEIGETSFLLGRYEETAIAYEEAYRYFQDADAELVPKIARNFLAAATRAEDARKAESHSALGKLRDAATRFNEERGIGLATQEVLMQDAQRFEQEGKFAAARETYLKVEKEVGGEKVPFYWRAQASAWSCILRLWEQADERGKQAVQPELEKATEELAKIVPRAVEDGDLSGAAVASLSLGQIHFQFERWDEAVGALKIFRAELAGESYYRCLGVGYLTIACARLGDCASAEDNFGALEAEGSCKEDVVLGYAAQAVSDCFYESGERKKAARYLLAYVRHPSSSVDLKDPQRLFWIAKRLIEGESYDEAEPYIEEIRKIIGAGSPELGRQILILDAERLKQQKKTQEAIDALERYSSEYVTDGRYEEDPYVLHDLAELYLGRSPRPQFKDYERADRHYRVALGIMKNRVAADKSLEKVFWPWALRYCELKLRIGEAGQPEAYGEVIQLVDVLGGSDMGGLKDEFLKLRDEAARRQKTAKPAGGRKAGEAGSAKPKAKR